MEIRQAFGIYSLTEPRSEMEHDGNTALSSIGIRVTLGTGVETLIQVNGSRAVHVAIENCGTALMVYLENPSRRLKAGGSSEQGEMSTHPSLRLDAWV